MTDDQDFRSMWAMPKTRALIGARGTTFQTSLVNFPLCCPSRATYYTGRYAHNHGRMGALLGVDDMVQRVVKVLRRTGEYRDTVIVFTSDNGWDPRRAPPPRSRHPGRPRRRRQVRPVRGIVARSPPRGRPRLPAGRTVKGVVTNADLAPTILDLAGARATVPVDGRSLLKAARDPARLAGRGVLVETAPNPCEPAAARRAASGSERFPRRIADARPRPVAFPSPDR